MIRKWASSIFRIAGVATLLIHAGCGGGAPTNPQNVLLITIDTLRPDRLHCYGNERIATPAIDRLAEEGVLFENAFTPIPITLPSHTSILTGLYPHQHGVRDNGVYRLDEETETIAEILGGFGYETAGFVSAHVLDHRYRINQGFGVYDDEMEEPLRVESPIRPGVRVPDHTKRWIQSWSEPYQRRAEVTVGRAVEWLEGRQSESPFFCWVHLFDPHLSYDPPAPWDVLYEGDYEGSVDGTGAAFAEIAWQTDGRVPRKHFDRMLGLYDGEIAYADHWVGRLLEAIPDSTIIVFASDHGEAFSEHGQFFEHQRTINRETVQVALIVGGPGITAGERRSELVSTIDIFPTILQAIGAPPVTGLPGRSLVGEGVRPGHEAIYTETLVSITAVPTPFCYKGARTSEWTLIEHVAKPDRVDGTSLHSIADDPAELENLYASQPAAYKEMSSVLESLIDLGLVDDADPVHFWSLDEGADRREQLRALGYLD